MTDKQTLDVYAQRAGDYAARFGDEAPGKQLTHFMSQLPKGGRVLDLGCGPGRSAAVMRDQGFVVDAWDASPQMAAIGAEKFGLSIEVRDFSSLTADSEYDGIYANFSLLHASKSEMPEYLGRIADALKPKGLFHIGLKSGDGEARDALGRFYAYYQDAELTALLEEAGLSVESRNFGADEGLDGTLAPWMILTARKI